MVQGASVLWYDHLHMWLQVNRIGENEQEGGMSALTTGPADHNNYLLPDHCLDSITGPTPLPGSQKM